MNLEVIDKPEGITTHQSNPNDWGIVEFVAHQKGTPLYVIQRLDKETSGVLLVAKDRETATKMTEFFEKRSVGKKYLFLTDRRCDSPELSCESFIERNKNTYTSDRQKPPNAATQFKKVWQNGKISLWEARPLSGKPHQIRLHALDLGIPILGDQEHQGSPWPRLALHAQSISFVNDGQNFSYQARDPWWAEAFSGELSPISLVLRNAFEKRQRLQLTSLDSYRLVHQESEDFSIDIYGSQAWVNWYRQEAPRPEELKNFEDFFMPIEKVVFLRQMNNRGQDPNSNQHWKLGGVADEWAAQENEMSFLLKTTQGLSAGLFLDQRPYREWVKKNSAGLSVLNLYSYTCGFSVAAALGQAKEVCSVDVSNKFLDWGKQNFVLNKLNPQDYEFWSQDCLLFLKGAVKRERKFDLIIIDPPSFGRSKDSVFRIEKDWSSLLDMAFSLLNPGGKILFSTNYEKWTWEDFEGRVRDWSKKSRASLQSSPIPGLDYELSSIHRLLKSIIISKK